MMLLYYLIFCFFCVCFNQEFFENPAFRPDGLKLYPTLVIRGTGLYELWKTGRYKSYSPSALVDLVARILALVPPWTRVYRVQRWEKLRIHFLSTYFQSFWRIDLSKGGGHAGCVWMNIQTCRFCNFLCRVGELQSNWCTNQYTIQDLNVTDWPFGWKSNMKIDECDIMLEAFFWTSI